MVTKSNQGNQKNLDGYRDGYKLKQVISICIIYM
nr:MAG TPA: hypothetical protein [Caudoviricetes sp.]